MKKISIKLNKNVLYFSYVENDQEVKNFVNSNSVYNNELLYTDSYIKSNKQKVLNAIFLYLKKETTTININSYNLFLLCFPIINSLTDMKKIVFDVKSSITKKTYEKLFKLITIREIESYYIPESFIKELENNKYQVKNTNKCKFSEEFMKDNEFDGLEDMYYKKKVRLNSNTYNNFEKFLTINRYANSVYLDEIDDKLINKVIESIKDKNITILIEENDLTREYIIQNIKNLKNLNKKFLNNKREIKIVYESSYIKNNLFKQLTYNNLKICICIILYLALLMIISEKYNDIVAYLNMWQLENTVTQEQEEIEEPETIVEEEIVPEEEPEVEEEVFVDKYANMPTSFNELLSINSDTVGWLKVNNTKINYPVTQSTDNDYYLNRDFYKSWTANGWIYMDYRNDSANLDKNTIIYGHALRNGTMFGELKKSLSSSWYKNKENQIISFNTPQGEMKFQIFSIYKTEYTTDYLKVSFGTNEEYTEFINLIKGRSIYNFNVDVNVTDKILTLSTCVGYSSENKRLVVHAKLIY